MEIEEHTTERGFKYIKFSDSYGEECSIQKSSSAMEDKIWFGISDPKLVVFENEQMGNYLKIDMPKQFNVSSRMHLTRQMVESLLPVLIKFVETGEI